MSMHFYSSKLNNDLIKFVIDSTIHLLLIPQFKSSENINHKGFESDDHD